MDTSKRTRAQSWKPLKSLKSLQREIAKNKMLFLMAIVIMVWYVIFRYVPYYWNLIAFKDYSYRLGFSGSPWVGLKHFKDAIADVEFRRVFRNTVIISGLKVFIGFPVPVILALFLNEVFQNWYKKSIQTVIFIPYFISWVIYASIMITILSPTDGLLNIMLRSMGKEPIYFLASTEWFRPLLIVSEITKNSGYFTVLFMSALASVDEEVYDASVVDGANLFQRIWHINLPGIASVVAIVFIVRLGQLFMSGFEQVYALYSPMVYSVGDIIETYVYRQGIVGGRFDYTTAVNLFGTMIGFTLVIITNYVSKKISDHGLW
jgi:putative aldouronate transport system permease protein